MKKRIVLLLLPALMLCACSAPKSAVPAQPTPAPTVAATPASDPFGREGAISLYENTRFIYEQLEEATECRVEYPALAMDNGDAANFPGLNKALDAMNADFANQGSEAFARIRNSALSDLELDVTPAMPYGRSTRLYIPRADDRALSVLCVTREYSGGAQESVSYACRSFDSLTGRELTLESVVMDASLLPGLLETALMEKYPEAEFYDLPNSLNSYLGETAAYTWSLDYQGLSFYFAPYELAPAEDGPLTVSLRFDERPDFFSQYYIKEPFVYSIPVIDGHCLNFDMDGDGTSDDVSIEAKYDKTGDYISGLDIAVKGRGFSASVSIDDYEAYVVHTGPGKNFLLLNAYNGGFGYISVYRLEKSGPALSGMVYESSLHAAGSSGSLFGKPVLTDPEGFYLGTKIELLSTMTGLKYYSIGDDGVPASEDAFYRLCTDVILSTVGEFSTATLDAETGAGNFSTVKITPGCAVYFWRSDGEGLVDVYTEDGVYCRLYVSGKGTAQKVNGMPAADCFEGMIYK